MFETIDKLFLAGLGAVSMTKEQAEKIFDEYVSRGKAERESKEGFVKEIMNKADKTRKDLEEIISKQISKTIEKLDLATKEDIKRLEEKLDKCLNRE
jgi:polyhydroxyalkanoate synthesis regulator phasin